MLNYTPLTRPLFHLLYNKSEAIDTPGATEEAQRRVLKSLIKKASGTEYGRRYGFKKIRRYEDFIAAVPATEFEDIRPMVMRMVSGEADVLWPGVCRRYAQSSGTSGGKSKYIPVTKEALHHNHYAGAAYAVAYYLARYPQSRLFGGKSLILGGSFAHELPYVPENVCVGDLSATLIDRVGPVVNLFRIPSRDIALLSDWNKKLPAIAEASANEDVTNISGVPSWFMTVLRRIIADKGAKTIHEVWPNLEVFFHGGIAFGPYREQYHEITDPAKMRYHENYNASEGFFATQDSDKSGVMRLLCDIGVFYEFVPLDSLDKASEAAIPAWKVEKGRTYAMMISSCNGLWRYMIGDTVRIESTSPLKISIAGRTNSFINAFGEELMVWNADKALAEACSKTGASIRNYTAAPVYASCGTKGHHQWLIEWEKAPKCDNEAFADILDAELQKVNSDYQAKRNSDIFLARLELTEAPEGVFDLWLASTGKLGGQRKIPRLSNDRRIIDPIIKLSQTIKH